MPEKKRKMAFYEIQKGKLAIDMQAAFEDAQKQSYIHGEPSTVTLKIAIYPPAERNSNYGAVQYAVSKSLPTKKSIKLTTQLTNDGIIKDDGTSVDDILQEELQFNEPTIHNLKEANNE